MSYCAANYLPNDTSTSTTTSSGQDRSGFSIPRADTEFSSYIIGVKALVKPAHYFIRSLLVLLFFVVNDRSLYFFLLNYSSSISI